MTTYNKNDSESFKKMFSSIAKQYDRNNAILSLQMHKYWNRCLIETTLKKNAPQSYLDLCCGTGEIALNYLKYCSSPVNTYLLDFCPEMLSLARERAEKLTHPHQISYIHADAQDIPLEKETIDGVTMAYGIRNIPHPNKCFSEVYRVLKSGGKIGILELTSPRHPILKMGHSLYLNFVVPLLGKLITSNGDAYQYLCNSIEAFIQPQELEKILIANGFKKITIKPLMGGIATIFLAEKL